MIIDMGFHALKTAYANTELTPEQVMADIRQRANSYSDYNIWLHLLTKAEQAPWLDALAQKDPATHPLWVPPPG